MELEKYIQQILYQKLPSHTGMHFYNTLPNKTTGLPFVKLDEISSHQILISPMMFEIGATLRIVSDKKSNVEVIDKFYEIKKALEGVKFFDLGEKLVGLTIGEPKFRQKPGELWDGEFKINLKIITNIGESIC